ncbi:Fc.00g056800.m01.CDS01 [Cosmosporella sp. VM-42]
MASATLSQLGSGMIDPFSGGHWTAPKQDFGSRAQATSPTTTPSYSTPLSPKAVNTPGTSSDSDALEHFSHTPLLALFNEALLLPQSDKVDKGHASVPHVPNNHFANRLRNGFPSMIPPKDVINHILDATKSYWCIWPACFHGPQRLQEAGVQTAVDFVLTSLISGNPSLVAKALLWLALCIFELPRMSASQHPELSEPQTLIDAYMHQAGKFLSRATEHGDTIDGVEALTLVIKLNIDLGRPRKAWLSARQAVSASVLLGLHRASSQNKRHEDLWRSVLHMEREISVVLGIPCSISNTNKSCLPTSERLLPHERLMHEMMVISGDVSLRDHSQLEANYAKTIELDQAWEGCKKLMPSEFWDDTLPPGLTFQALYFRQTIKLRYFLLGKLIHLPYMLKSTKEKKFTLSKTACLDASKEVIAAYQGLRNGMGQELAPCGMMDFASFCAAMVIIIDLLQQKSLQKIDCIFNHQTQNLLIELLRNLQDASTLKECTVAGRAANVIQVLLLVLRGERYEEMLGTTFLDHDIFRNFDMDAELNGDWSTGLEAASYDWVTVFQQDQVPP